ncbi:TMEM165/GDT1 family protein [Halomarina litorea]|uniref:TMEM165/GDT1 family protein n=1 Tax=Halomarina litorea TaxID=2961595 RepID=UPI0020C3C8F0|nr:TMEM165/GDT1 family protein [Halomarina sp. BCD28]
MTPLPLQDAGLQALIEQYAGYGPLAASFLVNLLATFGDKGQLVVVTLASRYDAKKVFAGSMTAFGLWSALEVLFGQAVLSVVPAGVMTLLTGGLFLLFGLWTAKSALDRARVDREESSGLALGDGGLDAGLTGRLLPDAVLARMGAHGGVLTSFVFIMFAEFGDKTQLLTINLSITYPDAPVSVFLGVMAALALRTSVDAVIGERVERFLPTMLIEAAAAVVFLAFGLLVLGVVPAWVLLVTLAAVVLALVGWVLRERLAD